MKTLAFLFLASLLFLFVGFVLIPGQLPAAAQPASPPVLPLSMPSAQPQRLPGSAKLNPEKRPLVVSRFVEAMETDDVCAAQALLNRAYFSPSDFFLVMKSVGAPPALQELFSPDGPLYGSLSANPARFQSDLARFVLALRLGGLETLSNTKPNPVLRKRARALLLTLEKKDPGNAAYPYYRLVIEKALGHSPKELMRTLETAAEGNRFDTLLFAKIRELEPLRWQSATHHYLLSEILERLSGFMQAYASLVAIRDLPALAEEKERLGNLMMEEGKRARRSHYFYEYSTEEYEIGNHLAGNKELSYIDLSRTREQEDFPLWYPHLDQKNCRREAYDDYLRRMRAYL
jgi:hypothetical protein